VPVLPQCAITVCDPCKTLPWWWLCRRAVVFALFVSGLGLGSCWDVARTPPMGFNTWNFYHCSVDAEVLMSTALAMVRAAHCCGIHLCIVGDSQLHIFAPQVARFSTCLLSGDRFVVGGNWSCKSGVPVREFWCDHAAFWVGLRFTWFRVPFRCV
jgi:hypothetical protein